MTSSLASPLACLLVAIAAAGCSTTTSSGAPVTGCPEGAVCEQPPLGPPHPHRADGTVDVTAEELWPKRMAESSMLGGDDLAHVCAILARCNDTTESGRLSLLATCLASHADLFWEERAVPTPGKYERFAFEAQEVLAAPDDCQKVNAITTTAPAGLHCEEDGCWWSSSRLPLPTVTCAGTVATLSTGGQTFTRDCSHARATCDVASPTGCDDRAPVACDTPAADRCDGPYRIGCDSSGKVSFHDCSRASGTCAMTGGGTLGCVYPDAGKCTEGDLACAADGTLTACSFGSLVPIPLTEIGLTSCKTM